MNHSSPSARNRAFTLIELVVVIVVIAVLACIILSMLANAKGRAQRTGCVSNLKQMGLAYRVFANDHGEQYPFGLPTAGGGSRELVAPGATFLQFRAMSNELHTPYILTCPADSRKRATNWASLTESNVSYFVGLDAEDTMPMALLSGDRNLTVNGVAVGPGLLNLTTNSALGWTKEMHRDAGNLVLGDGSVQQANNASMRGIQASGTTNRLLIP
jgi:prepilin-type N-terminal cleavage/methylation domain-containing protein